MSPRHAYLGLSIALCGALLFSCMARAHDWMPLNTRYCCPEGS